jgi:hypothetical protein
MKHSQLASALACGALFALCATSALAKATAEEIAERLEGVEL